MLNLRLEKKSSHVISTCTFFQLIQLLYLQDDEVEPSLNGEIIYGVTLAEVDDDTDDVLPVRIEPSSGAITLIRSLDYESRKLWKVSKDN